MVQPAEQLVFLPALLNAAPRCQASQQADQAMRWISLYHHACRTIPQCGTAVFWHSKRHLSLGAANDECLCCAKDKMPFAAPYGQPRSACLPAVSLPCPSRPSVATDDFAYGGTCFGRCAMRPNLWPLFCYALPSSRCCQVLHIAPASGYRLDTFFKSKTTSAFDSSTAFRRPTKKGLTSTQLEACMPARMHICACVQARNLKWLMRTLSNKHVAYKTHVVCCCEPFLKG